jgi:hypothetical protein
VRLNQKPIYDIKVGDRIHIFNTQLDQKLADYDKWKVFSALVTHVKHEMYGDDYRYQLVLGDYTSGWYDPGYLFSIPSPDSNFIATPLENVAMEVENKK